MNGIARRIPPRITSYDSTPHAKIIRHGSKAWIVRKKPLELDNGKRNKELVSSNLGIYALGMRSA